VKAYDLHRAWQKTFDRLHPGGYIRKSETEISLAAFKAGMLAAADIVWPAGSTLSSYDIYDDYGAGEEQAAKDIREAANE